jgi:hypothetical protein
LDGLVAWCGQPSSTRVTEAVIQRGDYNWMATETCYAASEHA